VVRGLEDELRKLFGSYVEKKNSNQALRLRRPAPLLARDDGRRRPLGRDRRLFDHVLVDEYQDTNVLQAEILARLRPRGEADVVGETRRRSIPFRAATIAT